VIYEFGAFQLDPAERLLRRDGQPVPLTPKAFDLLVYLVERQGKLVEKSTLMAVLWPDAIVEEANLAFQVSALRKALDAGGTGESVIQTVPTKGYRFVAPVRVVVKSQSAEVAATGPKMPAWLMAGALAAGPSPAPLMPARPHVVRFGVFELDVRSGELRKSGTRLNLPDQPLQFLKALIDRPGDLVTREELRQRLWPSETFVDFEHGLNAAVKRLRDVLSDSADTPQFIETVPRRGYRFIAPVGRNTESPDAEKQIAHSPRRRWVAVAVASAVLVMALAASYIWARRPNAPARMRVVPLTTFTGRESNPSFSPDGMDVVFSWNGEKASNAFNIYEKIIGANEIRPITSDSGDNSYPSWSPDGRQIAFRHEPHGSGDPGTLCLVSPLGGTVKKLSDLPTYGPFAWSPDGQFVAAPGYVLPNATKYLSSGIYLVPAQGGEARVLTQATPPDFDDTPAFSPDGRRLAYVSCVGFGGCDVYVIDLAPALTATGTARRLTSAAIFDSTGITWTNDGESIIYGTQQGGSLAYLWRVRADGRSAPERIEEAGPFAIAPAVALSRDRLAFSRWTVDWDVYASDGVHSKPLLTSSFSDSQAEYSPDGRRIAFVSERSGEQPELWLAHADGSDPVQLTHGPGRFQGSPHWSPDGQTIAFASRGDAGWRLWTLSADGGTPQQLTWDAGNQIAPTWSRDGQWIYYATDPRSTTDVWRIRPTTGQKEHVLHGVAHFQLESPDGRSLLYQPPSPSNAPLMMKSLAGGSARQLVPCVVHAAYGVHGNEVYYCPCSEGKDLPLHAIDPGTGHDRVVGILEQATPIFGISVSADGKTILYDRHVSDGADLMLIENFK
jgi:Tol biopolymer transport system component/DNA-binding winged helix-turn-helix (wHTH) protein